MSMRRNEGDGRQATGDGKNPGPGGARAYRLTSIDILRGLVVVIMALDHVRDHVHFGSVQDPMNDPNIGVALYVTRWVTHFCAPVFVCLAGVSAGLMTGRRNPVSLGGFLMWRGLWILAIELVVISFALTFAPLDRKSVV